MPPGGDKRKPGIQGFNLSPIVSRKLPAGDFAAKKNPQFIKSNIENLRTTSWNLNFC